MKTFLRIAGLALLACLMVRGTALAQLPKGTPEALFRDDVHAKAGLTCETCHGKPVADWYAPIPRTRIAPLCAHCHSDATYMRQFAAQPKVDQYRPVPDEHPRQADGEG